MATRVKQKADDVAPSTPLRRVRRSMPEENPAGDQAGTSYFASSAVREAMGGVQFFSSGCVLLDQVLGGGWALGRMSNIIGDKSTGKTLLAIEATANFRIKFPEGLIRYAEAESAFDKPYAAALGMPVDSIEFADFLTVKKRAPKARDADDTPEDEKDDLAELDRTVEYFHADLKAFLRKLKGRPGLYILDSLDALSDRHEQDKKDGDSSGYGMQKAKALHEMFRRLVGLMESANCALIIISQVKDNINAVSFGEKFTRTGGKSMDFYASHCLWLAHMGQVKKTVDKIERVVAVEVKANCKKNKVGLPFRQCTFNLLFGYGIDDLTANVEWLIDNNRADTLKAVEMTKSGYKTRIQALRNRGGAEMREVRQTLNAIVVREWASIETSFLPQSRKYS